MRQAGVIACLIIRGLCLVVELQRKLNVPWRLSTGNLSQLRTQVPNVWCVQLDVVEGIDEVSSELQFEPLRNLDVLVQTQIYIGVTRRAQVCELIRASAEGPSSRRGEVAIVGEPLEATYSQRADRGFSGNEIGRASCRERV